MALKLLPLAALKDSWAQVRVDLEPSTVEDYADAMRAGDRFPPVVAFWDQTHYWLADGFQRAEAARRAGKVEVEADVREGGKREALAYAASANSTHGRPRTPRDKANAVRRVLADPEWGKMSTNWVAQFVRVNWTLVDRVRAEMERSGELPAHVDTVTASGGRFPAHVGRAPNLGDDEEGQQEEGGAEAPPLKLAPLPEPPSLADLLSRADGTLGVLVRQVDDAVRGQSAGVKREGARALSLLNSVRSAMGNMKRLAG